MNAGISLADTMDFGDSRTYPQSPTSPTDEMMLRMVIVLWMGLADDNDVADGNGPTDDNDLADGNDATGSSHISNQVLQNSTADFKSGGGNSWKMRKIISLGRASMWKWPRECSCDWSGEDSSDLLIDWD